MSEADDKRLATGNFEITAVLTDKRQIRMTGYVYSDDTDKEVNERVDHYQDVVDRQLIRADVANKEAQVISNEANLELLAQHFQELTILEKEGKKLNSQQRQQAQHHESSVRGIKRQNESLRAAIAEGRKKLNG